MARRKLALTSKQASEAAHIYAEGSSVRDLAQALGISLYQATRYWRWMGWDRLPMPGTRPAARWRSPDRWWLGLTRDEAKALVCASRRALLARQAERATVALAGSDGLISVGQSG